MGVSLKVKKIMSVGGRFLCAVCQKSHTDRVMACACLENCWETKKAEFRRPRLVKSPLNGKRQLFACGFCGSAFRDELTASSCARSCETKMEHNYLFFRDKIFIPMSRSEVDHMIDDAKKRMISGKKSVQAPTAPRPKEEPVPVAKAPDVPRKVDVEVEAEDILEGVSDEADQFAILEVAEERVGPAKRAQALLPHSDRAKYSGPWRQQGVKFICSVCKASFFSRKEADTCFQRHFAPKE